jgi:hypothetical protein
MAVRKASDSNLTGKKYNDGSAGSAKIADVPELPTISSVSNVGTGRGYNNAAATVSFARNSKGGIPASYVVTSVPGGFTATGASSPLTVTGLQSGTSYTFVVKAVGGSGSTQTANTAASSSITATSVGAQPTTGTPTRTNKTTVVVPFTPADGGGSAITSYLVQSNPSIPLTVSGSSSPLTVTGAFAQNVSYTFSVLAVNENGNSTGGTSSSLTPNTVPLADGDTFNRTTTISLGNTTTADSEWQALTGTWYANGSRAETVSSTAVAVITMNSNWGTTKAGSLTPGTGLVYWATDANNYMATYSFGTVGTSTNCGGYSSRGCSGNGCNPGGCCTGVSYSCSATYVQYSPTGGSAPRNLGCNCNTCQGDEAARWSFCCSIGGFTQYYNGSCGTNATVSTVTNYMRTIKVEGGSASTIEDFNMGSGTQIAQSDASNNAPKLSSMTVATASNGSVQIVGYPNDNYTGTPYTTRNLNPTFNTKSNKFGIIKTSSGATNQGNSVDDFETTGF